MGHFKNLDVSKTVNTMAQIGYRTIPTEKKLPTPAINIFHKLHKK